MMATVAAWLALAMVIAAIVVAAPTFRAGWWAQYRMEGHFQDLARSFEEIGRIAGRAIDQIDALGYAWTPITGIRLVDVDAEIEESRRRRELQMYAELGLEARAKDPKRIHIIGDW